MLHSHVKYLRRFTSTERKWQILFVLLFHGPMNMMEIARTISNFTYENTDSVRVIIYRNIQKLTNLKLIYRKDRKYDLTPLGFHFLLNGPLPITSRYFSLAVIRMIEKRYPHLFNHITLTIFLCNKDEFLKDMKNMYSEEDFISNLYNIGVLSDNYIEIKLIGEEDFTLPNNIIILPKMENLLNIKIIDGSNNILEKDLIDILKSIYEIHVEEEEEFFRFKECFEKSIKDCQSYFLSFLDTWIQIYGDEYIRTKLGLSSSNIFDHILAIIYFDLCKYIEKCPINILLREIFYKYYDSMGLLTKRATVAEIEYHLIFPTTWINIVNFYHAKIIKDESFVRTLSKEELIEFNETLSMMHGAIFKAKEIIAKMLNTMK